MCLYLDIWTELVGEAENQSAQRVVSESSRKRKPYTSFSVFKFTAQRREWIFNEFCKLATHCSLPYCTCLHVAYFHALWLLSKVKL